MRKSIIVISIVAVASAVIFAVWLSRRYTPRKYDPARDGLTSTLMPDRLLVHRYGPNDRYDILVDDITNSCQYNSYLNNLWSYKEYKGHVVLRDGKFQYVGYMEEGDYEISYEGIIIRNEVIKYNWGMKTSHLFFLGNLGRSDAILQKYGLIIKKLNGRCVPVYLETGGQLELLPNREVIEQALEVVNVATKEYGKDIFEPEVLVSCYEKSDLLDGLPGVIWVGMTGKGLLDLYGVEIRWNEAEGRFEMTSELPESGVGIVDSKDLEILQNFERAFILDSDYRHSTVNPLHLYEGPISPLELYYMKASSGYRSGKTTFFAYDKISGRRLEVMNERKFPPAASITPIIYYRLLERLNSLLSDKYNASATKSGPSGKTGLKKMVRYYGQIGRYYFGSRSSGWNDFLKEVCNIDITWTNAGFDARDTETGERITFPRDEELLNEALKELNYYKEKCDFVNYFQIENYPLFLLSILRLYDVNLEVNKATNKYVLAPGPTDPEKFFQVVAEFTFVNDKSDTEYLKKHLTSW